MEKEKINYLDRIQKIKQEGVYFFGGKNKKDEVLNELFLLV